MKMYLNNEQTAKLIELGFEKPMSIANVTVYKETGQIGYADVDIRHSYSIADLIEMLPPHITHGDRGFISYLSIAPYVQGWKVAYTHIYIMLDSELVDALYDMIVKLKEEGVI